MTLPLALITVHTCVGLTGWLSTVTAYEPPLGTVKLYCVAPADTVRLLPPLFCSVRPEPSSPVIVPPTVKVVVEQLMFAFTTFALPTVPPEFDTAHTCVGVEGWVSTLTA